jgi:DNA-binding transcriptional ArsR family regulator
MIGALHRCADPPVKLHWGQTYCPNCKALIKWEAEAVLDTVNAEVETIGTGYFQVRHLIRLFGPYLGPYGIAIYCALLDHANGNENGLAWPTLDTLARETGMSHPQVVETLAMLEAAKLVEVVSRSRRRGNKYRPINLDEWVTRFSIAHLPAFIEGWKGRRKTKKQIAHAKREELRVTGTDVTLRLIR